MNPINSSFAMAVAGVILTALVGLLDFITGYQISFSIFYLIPIVIVTWYVGRWPGLIMSMLGMLSWAIVDRLSGHLYNPQIILVWNATVRLGFFVIIVFSLSRVKIALDKEQLVSRIDSMTGISNRKGFNERLKLEFERAQRFGRPLSLAYIDCDNFKQVNDRFGHQEGDELLAAIGRAIRNNIRQTDHGARMGGDEFALILSETGMQESLEVIGRLQEKLNAAMQKKNWPVTFSIGLVTYLTAPESIFDAVREADKLMYRAKEAGKGNLKQLTIE